jgi:hypothetical protein
MPNDAHHWRRARDVRYVSRSSSQRQVNVLVGSLGHTIRILIGEQFHLCIRLTTVSDALHDHVDHPVSVILVGSLAITNKVRKKFNFVRQRTRFVHLYM